MRRILLVLSSKQNTNYRPNSTVPMQLSLVPLELVEQDKNGLGLS
ncbi:hypothetical protein BVI434_310048 [Burkholderia vietnamiensis]|nr:hypothetical protein BVI434_310048 [Burkholderia vietnamiensis]